MALHADAVDRDAAALHIRNHGRYDLRLRGLVKVVIVVVQLCVRSRLVSELERDLNVVVTDGLRPLGLTEALLPVAVGRKIDAVVDGFVHNIP